MQATEGEPIRTSQMYPGESQTEKLRSTAEPDLRYLGLALYGARKLVNKLTGSLPLLR